MALPPDRTPPASSNKQDRDAAQQDGFLREVDEALRQDQMLGAVQRYGKPLAAAIVLGLAALAGYLWWDHSTKQAAAERSERTVLALDRLGSGGPAAEAAARDLEPLTTEGSDGSKAVAIARGPYDAMASAPSTSTTWRCLPVAVAIRAAPPQSGRPSGR